MGLCAVQLETFQVPGEKRHGGKRPGAGRRREVETEFASWAKEQGLSSKDLVERLGVSLPTVNGLLAERARPSLELAAKIAKLTEDDDGKTKFPPEYWLKIPKRTPS